MLRPRTAAILLLLLSVSCDRAWRGDGPPDTLVGTAWVGTNQAREERIDIVFDDIAMMTDVREDGSFTEEGEAEMVFSSPSDTLFYSGTYIYQRTPSSLPHDVDSGEVTFHLSEEETGDSVVSRMTFHNMRFYLSFRGSSYPTDRIEDSWVSSGQ